jgi:hypothetical protein
MNTGRNLSRLRMAWSHAFSSTTAGLRHPRHNRRCKESQSPPRAPFDIHYMDNNRITIFVQCMW